MSPLLLQKMPWWTLYCKAAEVGDIFGSLAVEIQPIAALIVEEALKAAHNSCLCNNICWLAPSCGSLAIIELHRVSQRNL